MDKDQAFSIVIALIAETLSLYFKLLIQNAFISIYLITGNGNKI